MDQAVKAAKQLPDVMFEHCTGYKHLPNLGTYNTRFHEGRAVEGAIAGIMTKSNTIGYLGSYKAPEVVLGVNAFTLAAQVENPKVTTRLIMIDSWFDTAKEAAAMDPAIDFLAVAASMGVPGERADDRHATGSAVQRALGREGPSLVEIPVR